MRPVLLHLAHNRYLNAAGTYAGTCGCDLAGLSAIGEEVGSAVDEVPAVPLIVGMAARTLDAAR